MLSNGKLDVVVGTDSKTVDDIADEVIREIAVHGR